MAVTLTTAEQRIGKDSYSFYYNGYSYNFVLRTISWYEQLSSTVARIHFKLTIENTTSAYWSGTNKQYTCSLAGNGVTSDTTWSNTIPGNSGQMQIYHSYVDLSPNTDYNLSGSFYVYVLGHRWSCSDTVRTPAFTQAPSVPTASIQSVYTDFITVNYGTSSFGIPNSGTVYLYGGTSSTPTTVIDARHSTGNGNITWSSLSANQTYYFQSEALNDAYLYSGRSASISATTPCPTPTAISIASEAYSAYNRLTTIFSWTRASDSGSKTRTGWYRLSTDGGNTWGSWTSLGTITNLTNTFTVYNIPTSSSISVQVMIDNGISSGVKTLSYTSKTTHIAPNFSNFTYRDSNATTSTITGNDQTMIQGQSTPEITISTSNKATGNDNVAVSNYSFNFSGRTDTATWSSNSNVVKTLGTPQNSGSQSMTVSAVDALSLSKVVSKSITVYPWQAPTINATISRYHNFDNESTLTLSGTWAPIKISGTDKNTLQVDYRYKESSSSSWGNWTNRPVTTTDNTWASLDLIASFDNTKQWDIQIRAVDKFTTTTVSLTLAVGAPNFFIGTDGRISIGGKPTQALLNNEAGLLDVKGRIFSNNNQVPTLPIIADNIDFSTFTGKIHGTMLEMRVGGSVDLNTCTTSGYYTFYSPINGPSGTYTYCTMIVVSYSGDYRCAQYFFGWTDGQAGVLAVRFSYHSNGNRTWSSWKTLTSW